MLFNIFVSNFAYSVERFDSSNDSNSDDEKSEKNWPHPVTASVGTHKHTLRVKIINHIQMGPDSDAWPCFFCLLFFPRVCVFPCIIIKTISKEYKCKCKKGTHTRSFTRSITAKNEHKWNEQWMELPEEEAAAKKLWVYMATLHYYKAKAFKNHLNLSCVHWKWIFSSSSSLVARRRCCCSLNLYA